MKNLLLATIDEVVQYFPGFKAFIDSTEQEIPKPENKRKKKSHYSGKRKRHTVKTQFMVNIQGLILHKTRHKGGRHHDYHLYKHNRPVTPPQVENIVDLGYLGIQKDFPESYHDNLSKKWSTGYRNQREKEKSELYEEDKTI